MDNTIKFEKSELQRIIGNLKRELASCCNAERREIKQSLTYFKRELAAVKSSEQAT